MIENNSDINAKDINGDSPLHHAIRNSSLKITNILIQNNANVNIQNNSGETPLHFACSNENNDIIDILLKNGANPNLQDFDYQNTPMTYLITLNNLPLVKKLIDNGADPNIQNLYSDFSLHHIARETNSKMFNFIEPYITNPNLTNINGKTSCHILMEKSLFKQDILEKNYFENILKITKLNIQDNKGNTILHYLTRYNLWKYYTNILIMKKIIYIYTITITKHRLIILKTMIKIHF